MGRLKKALAALAAGVMMFTLAGCSNTGYIMKCNDEEIKSGVYLFSMFNEMTYQMTMMYYMDGITENYFDEEVEGKSFSDYLLEKAKTLTKEYAAVTAQFETLGLSFTEDEIKALNASVKNTWDTNSALLEAEGISRESVKYVYYADQMRSKIFDFYYGDSGVEAVSDDELTAYVNDNFIRYKSISVAKSKSEDETEKTDEDAKQKQVRDGYLALASDVDFVGFDQIIDMYESYVASLNASEDGSVSDDEDTTDLALPTLEDAAVEGEEVTVGDIDHESNDDNIVLHGDTDGVIVDESVEGLFADDDLTAEEDTFEHETMSNYGAMSDEDKESNTGMLLAAIDALEVGKAAAYEDENYYYIIIKGDVTERSEQYASENRTTLVQTMKKDEFQSKIDVWVSELNFVENSEALRRYTPKDVYDRQEKYYEKQSKNNGQVQ